MPDEISLADALESAFRQPQANPALDKPAERLNLAGTGLQGAILKGLAGRISILVEPDEVLDEVKIYSRHENQFSVDLTNRGTYTHVENGRRRWDVEIVFGVDTDYGFTGAEPVRNYLRWKLRKRQVVNPTGQYLAEIPYSRGDSTAMQGATEEQLRANRPFFEPRGYGLSAYGSVDAEVQEASGLCWRDDDASLYVISDDLRIAVVDRELQKRQDTIVLPSASFSDTEAICYLGSDRFAVLDEGSLGVRPPRLHLFHLRRGQTELFSDDLVTHDLADIDEFAGGLGAEGLAYDPVSGKYYVGTQPTGDGQGGLWEVDWDTDGAPVQTLLFRWYDALVEPGYIDAGSVFADLEYSSTLAGGQVRRSIFAHFRTPDAGGSQLMRRTVQIDIDSGAYVDHLWHGLEGKWEGFAFSPDLEDVFIVREGTGKNIWRLEHRQNETEIVWERQFYVKDKPARGGIYVNGQEAQQGEAMQWINQDDSNVYAVDATVGISVLPTFNDEFFTQHEFRGNAGLQIGLRKFVDGELVATYGKERPNRYAQTLRNVGGVKTVEVFTDLRPTPVIAERLIEDLDGYYWPSPSYGLHEIKVRLRADWGSSYFVDIDGWVRFRQFACPEE